MASLYADEDFHHGVVERLRQRGHDVLTVHEAGRAGGDDSQVLVDATTLGRVVLTFNRWDYQRLHRIDSNHAGIVSSSLDDDLDALTNRIDQAIASAAPLAGQHIRVNRPAVP